MKKSLTVILMGFLVLGILMNSYFALGDDNSTTNAVTPSDTLNSDNSGNVFANSLQSNFINQDRGDQNQMNNSFERDYQYNGSRVRINHEVQVEDGNVTITITKTVTYPNGTQMNYTIFIQNGNQNMTRSINFERDGEDFNVSVEDGLNVSDTFVGNQSQIVVNLSNGNQTPINVLPDEAMQKALERLKLSNLTFSNGTNASIQLQERIHNNIPQVVYNIEGDRPGRFLGVFKLNMRVSTQVNPETGNIVSINQPWWAFLVSSGSSTSSASGNETVNQTVANTSNSSA